MGISFVARRASARASLVACSFAVLLSACGGGGDASAPTELPQTLVVNGPTVKSAMGASIEFSSNAIDTASALKYQWQFGDGATSTQPKPSHAYAKAGTYTVRVTITNEAGVTGHAEFIVSVSDLDLVRGKACNFPDGSGWCWQRPLPQGNNIVSYFYLDDKRGWAVGEAGTLLTTADAGVTWTAQHPGTDQPLNGVTFLDAQNGWMSGANGTILHTSDGGAHWTAGSIGLSESIQSITPFDANSAAILVGYSGKILVTQDGGARWKDVSYQGGGVQQYMPVSPSDIWAVSYASNTASLVHTTNGGTSWTNVELPGVSTDPAYSRSVQTARFSDALHGWAVVVESGYNFNTYTYVYRQTGMRTADGGATWQNFDADPFALGSNGYYNTMFQFVNANTAFARLGYSDSVKRSIDGGVTWQPLPLPTLLWGYATSFQAFTADVIIVRDYANRTYLTVDGGAHWALREASGTPSPSLNSVWFFDSREGVAIGNDGSSVRTTDGGQTWTTSTPNGNYGWRNMQFLADGSVGWVSSATGAIYRSTDKGHSWLSPVPQTSAPMYASDFHFVDSLHGWAVSNQYSAANLFRTVDGGNTWQALPGYTGSGGFSALRFADATHGVAVGPAGVALTTSDGGDTWLARPTGSSRAMRRITFIDSMVAVAVGDAGAIIRSNDRGQSWVKVAAPTSNQLNDVRFVSPTTGYATGDYGTVLVTDDAGMNWTLLPTGVNANLQSIFFTGLQTGWIVGDNGTIIVTATGGR